jgi:hypothetical protein
MCQRRNISEKGESLIFVGRLETPHFDKRKEPNWLPSHHQA